VVDRRDRQEPNKRNIECTSQAPCLRQFFWNPRGVSDLEIGQVAHRSLRKEHTRRLDGFLDCKMYFIVKIEPNSLYSI